MRVMLNDLHQIGGSVVRGIRALLSMARPVMALLVMAIGFDGMLRELVPARDHGVYGSVNLLISACMVGYAVFLAIMASCPRILTTSKVD